MNVRGRMWNGLDCKVNFLLSLQNTNTKMNKQQVPIIVIVISVTILFSDVTHYWSRQRLMLFLTSPIFFKRKRKHLHAS